MKFEDGVVDQAVVVSVVGRIDAAGAPLFEAHCKKMLADNQRKNLVVDLATVDYLSSAGLRAVLALGKQIPAAGGRLALCGIQGGVKEIFEMAGFLGLFPVGATIEDALKLIIRK